MADQPFASLPTVTSLLTTDKLLSITDPGGTPADKLITLANFKTTIFASPTLVTPTLGVATITSINKIAVTAPATGATLTIADGKTFTASGSITIAGTDGKTLTVTNGGTLAGGDAFVLAIAAGKTLTVSNTLTFTGTDTSSIAFGGGGTVAYVGVANSWADNIRQTFNPGANAAGINVGAIAGDPDTPVNGDLWYDSTADELTAWINGGAVALGAGGSGASVALDNLAGVAINTTLVSDTNNTDDLGTTSVAWRTGYFGTSILSPSYTTAAGVAWSGSATAPAATTGASQVGKAVTLTASAAVASTDTAGAAAGGSVTITAGNAARLTSGNAQGGDLVVNLGSAIGSGNNGALKLSVGGTTASIQPNGSTGGFNFLNSTLSAYVTLYALNYTVGSTGKFVWGSGFPDVSGDTDLSRIAAGVIGIGTGAAASRAGWYQWAGEARLAADATNATATMANLTSLTITGLAAGRKYFGRLILKCNNSTAAEGIQLDFNGGTATMTNFWAVASVTAGGTTVLGTVISTSLAGVMNFTTITGETLIAIDFSFVVNSVAGGTTIIPRFAENTSAAGTLTAELGSFIWAQDCP